MNYGPNEIKLEVAPEACEIEARAPDNAGLTSLNGRRSRGCACPLCVGLPQPLGP